MTVYFALRSEYEGPSGKFVRRFENETVLDWFRQHWSVLAADEDACRAHAEAVLGTDVYGFASLGEAIHEQELSPPTSHSELTSMLRAHLYFDGELLLSEHSIQVLTDGDEIELAYYFFDSAFLEKNPCAAAYLLHHEWQLPTRASDKEAFDATKAPPILGPRGDGSGRTYVCILASYDSMGLTDLDGARVIEGARVPELARWLVNHPPPWTEAPLELRALRAELLQPPREVSSAEQELLSAIARAPEHESSWLVYSDWLKDHDSKDAGITILERALRECTKYDVVGFARDLDRAAQPTTLPLPPETLARLKSGYLRDPTDVQALVSVADHVAQLSIPNGGLQAEWIFFDDLWATAHPDLANAILRFASRWDVLSD